MGEERREARDPEETFEVELELEEGYRFTVRFDLADVPPLRTDEPPPVGGGDGPNPSRLVAAAAANCLAASLLFCLRKARVEVSELRARVRAALVRNESGRLRIGELDVTLRPRVPEGAEAKLDRCLALFEDFCIVTQSLRSGIDVAVDVEPLTGDRAPPESASGEP